MFYPGKHLHPSLIYPGEAYLPDVPTQPGNFNWTGLKKFFFIIKHASLLQPIIGTIFKAKNINDLIKTRSAKTFLLNSLVNNFI